MIPVFVLSFFSVDVYEILVIQDKNGNLLTIKIEEYEQTRDQTPKYFSDDEIIH